MLYFTSDTHFDHKNVIKYSNRPFSNIEEMNEKILENINNTVARNDTLWHLGDFGFSSSIKYFRDRIKCKNVNLILGNHDKKSESVYRDNFNFVGNFHELSIKEYNFKAHLVVLCHYALKVWNKSHYGTWHLYGHSHGNLPDDPKSLSFDCGVDCHNYKPISVVKVAELMSYKNPVLLKKKET